MKSFFLFLRRSAVYYEYRRNNFPRCLLRRFPKGSITRCVLDGVFMSDKPFVAEACPPMLHASASNGLSDIETHIETHRVIDP
jgi:hypothetical protein